jgi:hypothetical protein
MSLEARFGIMCGLLLFAACKSASNESAGPSGASGTSGAGSGAGTSASGDSADAVRCEALCAQAQGECAEARQSCESECKGLLAVVACAPEVETLLECQERASGSCEDGEFIVEGCDSQAQNAALCVLGAGGASGEGGAGNGAAGTETAGSGGISSSEAIDLVIASCETACGVCAAASDENDCINDCRVLGARRLECIEPYRGLLACDASSACSTMLDPACSAELQALRDCWSPEPRGELSCIATCESRAEPACLEDPLVEVCSEACNAAAEKPECSTVIDAYTSCAGASQDTCLPSGYLWTECTEQIRELQRCADVSGHGACNDCAGAALNTGGVCFDLLEQCGDTFMDCTTNLICLQNCLNFAFSQDQTFEQCAASCTEADDPLNFGPVTDCVACNCTEECEGISATCM